MLPGAVRRLDRPAVTPTMAIPRPPGEGWTGRMALLPSPVPPPDGYRGAAGGTASPPGGPRHRPTRSPRPPPGGSRRRPAVPRTTTRRVDRPSRPPSPGRVPALHAASGWPPSHCTPPPDQLVLLPRSVTPLHAAGPRRRPGRPPSGQGGAMGGGPGRSSFLPPCGPPGRPRGPPGRRLRAPAGRGPAGRPRRPGRGPGPTSSWPSFALNGARCRFTSIGWP